MPEPTPEAPRKPAKPKKAPGPIRQKVTEKVKAVVPDRFEKGVEKSVAIATTTVSWPLRFLKNTLFLVRTEIDGMLLLHLPALDADPNRGATYGFMPVLLIPDRKAGPGPARIETIFAPSVTYNRIFGLTGTVRLAHFHDRYRQLTFTGSLSEHTNRSFSAYFANERFIGDRYLELNAFSDRDGAHRFYGVGPESRLDDQANYTKETLGYRATFGLPILDWINLGFQHRLEAVNISEGPLEEIPDLAARFPGFAPADQITLAWYRLYASYDTRDSSATPMRGRFVRLFWEVSPEGLLSDRDLTSWGGDARFYFPHGDSLVFTPRLRFETVKGEAAPFYALSKLGGKTSLRGYGAGRFVDEGMFTAGAEERWTGFRWNILGTPIEFETGPFVESGQVFRNLAAIDRDLIRTVGGLFIRGIARPQLVGSLDVGYGREGVALFLDVDYSW